MVGTSGAHLETVYIVDDDVTFARSIARLVGAAGWDAQVYASPRDFLAAGSRAHPGCVLLDVRMPGMHGPDLYRTMIQRHIDLPVIFLTGHGDAATKADAMRLGAVDFLEKPVRSDVLLGRIRTALARDALQCDPESARREAIARVARLTPREHEVMSRVVAGSPDTQIAIDLGLSLRTVKAHHARVMEKLEVGSVRALVDLCNVAGVADPGNVGG